MTILCFRLFAVLVLALLAPAFVRAGDIYTIDLFDLRGNRSNIDNPLVIHVDAGKSLSKIKKVRILLEGYAQPGKAVTGAGFNEEIEIPVTLQIQLANQFQPKVVDASALIAHLGPFNMYFREFADFYVGPLGRTDWSFLEDGRADLRLSWEGGCPSDCRYLKHASVDIQSAYLEIETD